MLDEFILDQLEKVETEYQELNRTLLDLNEEEKEVQSKIDSFLDSEDLGVEFFSPRTNTGPLKEKIAEAQKHLEEIHMSQMNISDKIARNREKEDKYQNMLNEIRMSAIQDDQTEISQPSESKKVPDGQHTQELKEILDRIEKCINLVNHDRTKCKNELKNLRYYLKALIANDSTL